MEVVSLRFNQISYLYEADIGHTHISYSKDLNYWLILKVTRSESGSGFIHYVVSFDMYRVLYIQGRGISGSNIFSPVPRNCEAFMDVVGMIWKRIRKGAKQTRELEYTKISTR